MDAHCKPNEPESRTSENDWKASAVRLGYILASNPACDDFQQKFIVLSAPCESALGALIALGAQAAVFKNEDIEAHDGESIAGRLSALESDTKLYECSQKEGIGRTVWIKVCAANRNCASCNHSQNCYDPPNGQIRLKKFIHESKRSGINGPPHIWKIPNKMVGSFVPVDYWTSREEWGIGHRPYPEAWKEEVLRLATCHEDKGANNLLINPNVASTLICSRSGISKSAQMANEIIFSCGGKQVGLRQLVTTQNPLWYRHEFPWFTYVASARSKGKGISEWNGKLVIFEGIKAYRRWQYVSSQRSLTTQKIIILSRSGCAAEQQENCDFLRGVTQFMNSVGLECFENAGIIFPEGLSMLVWEEKPRRVDQW
jgi:hypothetical protein